MILLQVKERNHAAAVHRHWRSGITEQLRVGCLRALIDHFGQPDRICNGGNDLRRPAQIIHACQPHRGDHAGADHHRISRLRHPESIGKDRAKVNAGSLRKFGLERRNTPVTPEELKRQSQILRDYAETLASEEPEAATR